MHATFEKANALPSRRCPKSQYVRGAALFMTHHLVVQILDSKFFFWGGEVVDVNPICPKIMTKRIRKACHPSSIMNVGS